MVKNLPAKAGDVKRCCSIPGLGRSPKGAHGNLLQYSCLENPMERGAWWVTVHRIAHRLQRIGHDGGNLATNSVLKSRTITLPAKVHRVKAIVFPVVMHGCESSTIKIAEH